MSRASSIEALAFSSDGGTLYFAIGSDQCVVNSVNVSTRESKRLRELPFCPERLTTFPDGSVLISSSPASRSAWLSADGSIQMEGRTILAALDASHLLEKTADGLVWVDGERSVILDEVAIRDPRIATGGVLLAVESANGGERLVRFDGASPSGITEVFGAIDSWDPAPGGGEVVFSARVDGGFDIGIVSVSGGEVRWVAPDPADEKNVTWAPRGSKITYTFESLDATLVRSVHVPTSFQVIFDLPLSSISRLAWEPKAERFAMVLESPASGARIDWVGYQGDGRAALVDATENVDSPIEALFWEGGSGVLLGPETVRYGQTRATVVWIEAANPFAWRPDLARLRREGLPALVLMSDRTGNLPAALADLPWVEASRLYIVDVSGAADIDATTLSGAVRITREGIAASEGASVIAGDDEEFRALAAGRVLETERAGH